MTSEELVCKYYKPVKTLHDNGSGLVFEGRDGTVLAMGNLTGLIFGVDKAFIPKRLVNNFVGPTKVYYPVLYSLVPEDFTPVWSTNKVEYVTHKEWLYEWHINHTLEAKHFELSHRQAQEQVDSVENLVLFIGGQPVSYHAVVGTFEDIAMVSRGYTPPEHRGKGYGIESLSLICEDLFERGYKKICWFTENPKLWAKLNPKVWGEFCDMRSE